MNFINLTPHTINILVSGEIVAVPTSGKIARCEDVFVELGDVGGIPTVTRRRGAVVLVDKDGNVLVQKFPEEDDHIVLVSGVVRDALAETDPRRNVFAPDTGSTAVRNEKGHILHVTRLVAAR